MNSTIDNQTCSRPWYRSGVPIAWLALIIFDLCLVALAYAQDRDIQPEPEQPRPASQIVQLEGDNDVAENATRFEAIDVYVDSGNLPLAAYQFELQSKTPGVEIVGIEGGEHSAFAEPPFYDPRAMNNNRVVVGAFSTKEDLPSGKNRVARIHVQLTGPGMKEYRALLRTSATIDGERIPAKATIARIRA